MLLLVVAARKARSERRMQYTHKQTRRTPAIVLVRRGREVEQRKKYTAFFCLVLVGGMAGTACVQVDGLTIDKDTLIQLHTR